MKSHHQTSMHCLAASASLLFLQVACVSQSAGGESSSLSNSGSTADTGVSADARKDTGVLGAEGNRACATGEACGLEEVCAGGVCCAAESACGETCCPSPQICSFHRCVVPGAPCFNSLDCADGEYCAGVRARADAGASVEASCISTIAEAGHCIPNPPACGSDTTATPGEDCLETCEISSVPTFAPSLNYVWGGHATAPFPDDVMMAPVVIELDDDNCDGKVDARDIPEIVFATCAPNSSCELYGTLRAISIFNGEAVEKWSQPEQVYPLRGVAAGDFDRQPGNEVVACGMDGTVHAYRGDGTLLWKSPQLKCFLPALADLDGDGAAEVVVEGAILNGKDGTVKAAYEAEIGALVVADIDGDGELDVVTPSKGFHADGKLFVDTLTPGYWPAIGDFDLDGSPEIVAVYYESHTVSVWRFDSAAPNRFAWVRQGVNINEKLQDHCPAGTVGNDKEGKGKGGGPPVIADFNGDGFPDIGIAGGIGYTVLDGAKLMNASVANADVLLWTAPTSDCSSAVTGSTVFDFNGDGRAEVIYSDETHLRIYQGDTGSVLWEVCNTTHTVNEYPLVADVDNDGHADIVVVSNAHASPAGAEYQCAEGENIAQAGVRVFGDPTGNWVRTRRVWNQHSYHVTNVNEDGTIPRNELTNWKQPALNNFRQNKQPGAEFLAPDAVVALRPSCGSATFSLVATVTNVGQAQLPAGVVVGFYAGAAPSGVRIGEATTTLPLNTAQSESLALTLNAGQREIVSESAGVYAVVDDASAPHPSWVECRRDNNVARSSGKCSIIK